MNLVIHHSGFLPRNKCNIENKIKQKSHTRSELVTNITEGQSSREPKALLRAGLDGEKHIRFKASGRGFASTWLCALPQVVDPSTSGYFICKMDAVITKLVNCCENQKAVKLHVTAIILPSSVLSFPRSHLNSVD